MQLDIQRRGSKALIVTPGLPAEDKEALKKVLGYKSVGNAYLNKRRGKAVFATDFTALDTTTMSFPAGLMPRVTSFLKRQKHEVTVGPGFTGPTGWVDYKFTRPYQELAALALLKHYCGHVSIPTGGGKTHVIGALVKMLNGPSLVVVPSLEILGQVHNHVEEVIGDHVSRLGGRDVFTDSHILIGTYQTLISRVEANDVFTCRFMADVDAIIVDESHHLPCDSIRTIIDQGRKLRYTYGLSATPRRRDGLDILMEGAVGPLRFKVTPKQLMDGGYIVGGDVTMTTVPAVGRTGGTNPRDDYHKIYKEHLTGSKVRRALEVNACVTALMFGLKTICFTKHVGHAEDIWLQVSRLQNGVELLTGETRPKDRERILNDINTGKVRLVVTTIGKEGLDVPSLGAVVFAEGGSDPEQQIGRVLRPCEGKSQAFIFDFYDAQHGMLEAQSKARLQWYEEFGIFRVTRV